MTDLCRRCDRPRSEHTIGDQLCPGQPQRFAPLWQPDSAGGDVEAVARGDRLRVEHHVDRNGRGKSEWWELRTPTGAYLATCCDPDVAEAFAARATRPQAGVEAGLAERLRKAVRCWKAEPPYLSNDGIIRDHTERLAKVATEAADVLAARQGPEA